MYSCSEHSLHSLAQDYIGEDFHAGYLCVDYIAVCWDIFTQKHQRHCIFTADASGRQLLMKPPERVLMTKQHLHPQNSTTVYVMCALKISSSTGQYATRMQHDNEGR